MRLSLAVSTLLLTTATAVAFWQPATLPSTQPVVGAPAEGRRLSAKPPAIGDIAPDFTLPDLDGSPAQLSKLTSSGPVVVIFLRGWVGYQCPLCTKQMGDFLGHAEDLKAAHARVLLVYPGPADEVKEKAKEFIAAKTLPEHFTLVTDADLSTINAYHLRWMAANETVYPSTFVIGTDGKVAFAKVSHSHGDRASAKDVLKSLPKM